LLIRGQNEEEIEKKILHKAVESYSNGTSMTIDDFLISMNIHITPLDDSHGRLMSSFLEEIFSNTSSAGKKCTSNLFRSYFG